MKKFGYVLMSLLIFSLASCKTVDEGRIGRDRAYERQNSKLPSKELEEAIEKGYVLKGTNSEIMDAFKNILSRYEFEEFSGGTLKIVTKERKLDESSPYYEANKQATDIYDQYIIDLNREEYDMIVKIKYLILTQKMNMKTKKLGFVEVNRIKEVEDELIKNVKRLLYGT